MSDGLTRPIYFLTGPLGRSSQPGSYSLSFLGVSYVDLTSTWMAMAHCNAERCLRAEFGDVPQVTREGGRGRKAAIPKIRERADGDREKCRCRCVGVERWRVDVMRRRR